MKMTTNFIYRMKDLRTVAGYFRNNPRYGRTTKLVHIPTGTVMVELMGIVPKGECHINYLSQQTLKAAELLTA
jgi:DNA topoisomerase IB